MRACRRVLAYRLAASAFLAAGAFAVVALWLQKINPGVASYEEPQGFLWYVIGSTVAVILLMIAWRLNLKAIKLHEEIT